MKHYIYTALISLVIGVGTLPLYAQSDPTLMTINGKSVSRSEFEYIYNKNKTQAGDQLALDDYLKLFINFKLKVALAEELKLDTAEAFRTEFQGYRSQVASTYLDDPQANEQYARQQYDSLMNTGEWKRVRVSYIFKYLPQEAGTEQAAAAKKSIDSIYTALKNGADFATLAKQCSDDKGNSERGGEIGWVERHRAVPQFEKVAFDLSNNSYSEPFSLTNGYCIVLKHEEAVTPFEAVRQGILNQRTQQGFLSAGKVAVANRLRSQYGIAGDDSEVLAWGDANLEKNNKDFAHLMQEYRDGMLLFEVSKQEVWDKAGDDAIALAAYFNANKAKYAWDEPHFKGIAVHTRDKATMKAVKKLLKKTNFTDWSDAVRKQFNTNDSIAVRAQIGLFTKGINKYVDAAKFKGEKQPPVKDYPYTEVIGKMLKKAPEAYTDVKGAVTADYQNYLESQWIDSLQKRFPVVMDQEILKTVNNH